MNRAGAWRLLLVFALLTGAGCTTSATLRPFTSDGCSDFPEGTSRHKNLWRSCCIEHDRAYWKGGSCEERRQADQALQRCVVSLGEPEIAALMLAGVRVGGSPYWPTRFRWGYGWPWPRGYRALRTDEREQVRRALESEPRPAPR